MTAQIIDTPDFTLRPFRAADASAVASKIANWDVIRMLTTPPHPYRRQDAVNHIARVQNDDWHWVIDIGGPAGSIAIGKQLGYWLAKPHWGQGVMTKAATLVLDRWFGAGAEKATSGHLFDNPASRRVLTKLGFVETGRSKAHANSRGGPVEHVDMVLTRAAWESGRSSRAGRPGDAEDPRA